MADFTEKSAIVIASGSVRGHVVINRYSPLRRINYFDGKFIRAPDMIQEQQALLNQIRLSNSAGGAGVVHGYDCTLGGNDQLLVSAGHAIDPQGRALLMSDDVNVVIGDLITKSRNRGIAASAGKTKIGTVKPVFDDCMLGTSASDTVAVGGTQLYVITLNHTEAYCGEEDVYGKLCSEACSTSTNRTYIIEGVEIRAVPIDISRLYLTSAAVNLSAAHLRSRVAAAYFEQERQLIASHISGDGLRSGIWCLGAEAADGNGVPIAIVARSGDSTLFLDAWIARRERMQAPPGQYWAQRMAMRPWPLFLAQVLQFQCQLRALLAKASANAATPDNSDPCSDTRKVAAEAAAGMRYLLDSLSTVAGRLSSLNTLDAQSLKLSQFAGGTAALELQYQKLIDAARVVMPRRVLISGGIVELPSAGYLPVNVNSSITVNEQVRRLLGEGVDLRFCVVTPDYVPHALEEAQHMERISLLRGLDDAAQKPHVDVLVPNGEIRQPDVVIAGTGYQSTTNINGLLLDIGWPRRKMQKADVLSDAGAAVSAPAAADEVISVRSLGSSTRLNVSAARRVDDGLSLPMLSGAARGDAPQTGGINFALAARSQQRLSAATSALAMANAAPNNVLTLLDDRNSTAMAAKRNRFTINSNLSVLEDARASLAESTFLTPATAVWVEMKIARDPFAATSGESIDVQAKLVFTTIRNLGEVNELIVCERSIQGQLQIERAAQAAPATSVSARLVASGVWRDDVTRDGDSTERVDTVRLNESVTLARRPVDGVPPTISVTVVNPSFFGGLTNIQLIVQRVWTSPLQSTFRLLVRSQQIAAADLTITHLDTNTGATVESTKDTVLLESGLLESGDVLKAGNSWHSTSLQALTTLEKALNDKGFAAAAQRALFPPALVPSAELEVLARLPWVLFHRRRAKTCSREVVSADLPVARRYRVFHVELTSEMTIARVIAALQSDVSTTLAALKPQAVTVVEFAAGNAVVNTAAGDVRADWQSHVQSSADLQLALIASEGDVINEGDALAQSRLQSLTNVLDPVTEEAAGFTTLNLNEVPTTLAGAEVDGIVVYFTRAVATVAHSVYRLLTKNPEQLFESIEGYLANQGADSLPTFIQRQGGQVLSTSPRFYDNNDTYFAASDAAQLDAAWDLVNDGPVSHALVLAPNDETQAQQLVTRQQSSRICQTIGSTIAADAVRYRGAPVNLLKPNPKATLLIAQTVCNDVYSYIAITTNLIETGQTLVNFVQNQGITAELLNSSTTTGNSSTRVLPHFRAVDFYRGTAQFETASRDAFNVAWQTELGGVEPTTINTLVLAIARVGGSAAETAANLTLAQSQGVALRNLMGLTQAQVLAATNNPQVTFPIDCQVLTVIVVARAGGYIAGTHMAVTTNMAMADTTSSTGASSAAQPAFNADLASGVRFDAKNEVIRDAAFAATVESIRASAAPVGNVEVVSIDEKEDATAKARANALLSALREEGAASAAASVTVRKAEVSEQAEIVRSGFALDRGFVLRR